MTDQKEPTLADDIETVEQAMAWSDPPVGDKQDARVALSRVVEAARASETWLRRSTTAEAEAEYQTARAEAAETKLAEVTAERDAMHVAALRERIRALEEAIKQAATHLRDGYPGFALANLKAVIGEHMVTPVAGERARAASTPEETKR